MTLTVAAPDEQTIPSSSDESAAPDRTAWLVVRRGWVRVLGVILAMVSVPAAAIVVAVFSVASPAHGWAPAAATFAPGLLGAVALIGFASRRKALAASTAVALLLGIGMYQWAPPDHDRLRAVADQVGTSPLWTYAGQEATGNTWCFNGCPEIESHYLTEQPTTAALNDYTTRLTRAGFTGGPVTRPAFSHPSKYAPLAEESWSKGRWQVEVRIPSNGYAATWRQSADPRARLTPVEVRISAR